MLSKNDSYYDNKNVKVPYIKCLINTQDKNIDLMYDIKPNKVENLESIYESDNRNRIEEIDKKGYFDDSGGYRFDKYIASEHFELYYNSNNELNELYASSSIEILEKEYDRILDFLDVDEKDMPVVKINMYDNYEAFRQNIIKEYNVDIDIGLGATGYSRNTNTFSYTLRYKHNEFVGLETVALHEFAHNVTRVLAPKKLHDSWIFEGTAMYLAQDADRYEHNYRKFLDEGIPEMYTLKKSNEDVYKYGYSMVEYIVETYGKEKLVELLREYEDIEKVLNISENEFRDGWIEFLKGKANY